jgi:hypothetical protein
MSKLDTGGSKFDNRHSIFDTSTGNLDAVSSSEIENCETFMKIYMPTATTGSKII